ncbi:MAG: hypothetical protein M2R45_04657 [Verrucomicrobia subdivision 3 bacterium]|nr:hypothetical protein [Limisphaerales bacterium]
MGDGIAVDDDLNGDFAGIVDAASFDVPVGFLVESALADPFGCVCWFWCEEGGCVEGDFDFPGLQEVELAELAGRAWFAQHGVVNFEVKDMAHAVTAVASSILEPLDPGIEIQFFSLVEFYVDAAEANLISVDAWEVGLSANFCAETAVQRMVPNVEFPDGGGVDC